MIINRYKTAKAEAVLAVINGVVKNEEPTLYLDMYSNSCEQGYHLRNNDKCVSFSENRNSDEIVVYPGTRNQFDDGNVINETGYKNRKYFGCDEYEKAANWIVDYLCGETNEG